MDGLEGAEVYQLCDRRSGAERMVADKLKAAAQAQAAKDEEIKEANEVTQLNRLNKAPSGPMGF